MRFGPKDGLASEPTLVFASDSASDSESAPEAGHPCEAPAASTIEASIGFKKLLRNSNS